MLKSELINKLGKTYGFKSFLGISTPTTGHQHHLIDSTVFEKKDLFIYNVANDFKTPDVPTFRTSLMATHEIVTTIRTLHGGPAYDLVFADPHHTYENSYEDIVGAFSLVRPGGALVVHDCNPLTAEIAAPILRSGEWCGVTYWAFIDFCLGRRNIRYYTVDTDYGCGVVFKQADAAHSSDDDALEAGWAAMCGNDSARFRFFDEHRKALLKLVDIDEFHVMENIAKSATTSASNPSGSSIPDQTSERHHSPKIAI